MLPVLTTRREFICGAARTLVAGVAAPLLLSACHSGALGTTAAPVAASGQRVDADVSRLAADGDWLIAPWMGSDAAPVLVVRQSAGQYLALSMQCTHMGCPVNAPVQGVMTCPCHGSQFDLAGQVRHGPAQYPLGRYATAFDATTKRVTVTLG